MRLLIVEDESRLLEIVKRSLEAAGFAVDAAQKCADARTLLVGFNYDAVILDLGLPDGDGLAFLAEIRKRSAQLPVLVLTARDSVEDRVIGLDAGADDYMIKPFAIAEVVARMKALLRRPGGALGVVLQAGNIAFDTVGRDVKIDGCVISLPRREVSILEHLMRRLGRVVPKSVLEEKIYGIDDEVESNAVSVHIHHLRKKLVEGSASAEIHTVRGVGYVLTEAHS